MHIIPRLIIITAVIAMCLTGGVQARTNAGDISIETRFGFGGYYKPETPTPLFVKITNSGEMFVGWALADLGAWVPPTYYTKPVMIPPGGSQEIELENFGCYTPNNCIIEVQVMGQTGDPVSVQTVHPWMLGRADTLLVHLGQPIESLDSLFTGINPGYLSMAFHGVFQSTLSITYPPKIYPVTLEVGELPENFLLMEGIGSIAMTVATHMDLDEQSKLLLFEYVSHGGNLIIYYDGLTEANNVFSSEVLLPVSSGGMVSRIESGQVIERCVTVINKENFLEYIPPRSEGKRRGLHGEVIEPPQVVGEDERTVDFQSTGRYEGFDSWKPPPHYNYLDVIADPGCEEFYFDTHLGPGLTVKSIGNGRVGFLAFNPFIGGPTADDEPIFLLGVTGLLDPECPTRNLAARVPQDLRNSFDSKIQDFFRQGMVEGQSIVMRWLEALGPAMIYLLMLPVLAILAKRRGRMILALFVLWSVAFTVFILVSKVRPAMDKVQLNQAALLWCETLPPGENVAGKTSSSIFYSCVSYSAQTSAPHNVTWDYPGAVLDELVNRETWPYGSITIDHPGGIRIPDLRLETITFRSTGIGDRIFVLRRPAEEISSSGVLTIDPLSAHIELDAEIPYPVVASRLVISSHNSLWVGKEFGALEKSISIDTDLINGSEIRQDASLFPDYMGPAPQTDVGNLRDITSPDLGHTLETLWRLVMSMPVGRAQSYTQSRFTGRPTQAYLVMATTELGPEFTINRGETEHHGVSIVVITVPIVYKSVS